MSSIGEFNPHLDIHILNSGNIVKDRLMNGASPDLNVDGSSVAVIFKAVPPAGTYWMVTRLMIYFSGATPFSEELFGTIAALTNGVSVMVDNVEIVNWKDNMDVQTSMFDAQGKAAYAKVDRSIAGRWSFTRHGAKKGIRVNDEDNGFGIKIQDALQTLTQFRARVQGMQFTKPLN